MDGIPTDFIVRGFCKAGEIVEVCDRTRAEHEMIVLQFVMILVEAMRYAHECPVEVNRLDYSCKEIDSLRSCAPD